MSNRNRHKDKNNLKPIINESYSPLSVGGRISLETLKALVTIKNDNTNGKTHEKSLQTKGKEE
jgi:hypothetical protein